jgi:hypothetical protein
MVWFEKNKNSLNFKFKPYNISCPVQTHRDSIQASKIHSELLFRCCSCYSDIGVSQSPDSLLPPTDRGRQSIRHGHRSALASATASSNASSHLPPHGNEAPFDPPPLPLPNRCRPFIPDLKQKNLNAALTADIYLIGRPPPWPLPSSRPL